MGGGLSVSADVGDGAVSTDASFSGGAEAGVSGTAAFGPCEVSASGKVGRDFFDPCNGPSAKAEAKAKCDAGDYSVSADASTTLDAKGVQSGYNADPPARASKEKKTSAKAKAKVEASATAQVCAGGGATL